MIALLLRIFGNSNVLANLAIFGTLKIFGTC